ncbi:MAG: nucleotidyl transferase AbiEii/AbiGii toxin family protein [Bdellovibrionota bacterium]
MNEQSLKDKLKLTSKELNLSFNSCLKVLFLERFLVRLSLSSWKEKFIFKGGMLLAKYLPLGRETIDLDFLATKFNAGEADVVVAMREISSLTLEDGFVFEFIGLTRRAHEHTNYPGFEASFQANFNRVRERFFIDIGIGDVVSPVDESIDLMSANKKPIFEDAISLIVYPIETIFAEKVHTMVARGAGNSRMKDYHDVYLILQSKKLPEKKIVLETLKKTFSNRKEDFKNDFLSFAENELETLSKLWKVFKGNGKQQGQNLTPEDIRTVIKEINEYLASIL